MTDDPEHPANDVPSGADGVREAPSGDEVAADRRRSRRSVSFILAVVAAAVAVIVGLALWVAYVPYEVDVPFDGVAMDCDGTPPADAEPRAALTWKQDCGFAEAEARGDRRNTAFVLGVGAFVVATAVSTWPSRRLTGERLGPLR